MTSPRPAETGLVAQRLWARKRRVSAIRRRVAAIAATTFLASSGGIFLQLVTDNDPALAGATTGKAAVTSATNATAGTATATKVTVVTTRQS